MREKVFQTLENLRIEKAVPGLRYPPVRFSEILRTTNMIVNVHGVKIAQGEEEQVEPSTNRAEPRTKFLPTITAMKNYKLSEFSHRFYI